MFARAVKEVRARHGLSQQGAEIRTGVDRFTISRMESGLVPRLDIVEKWARGFGEDVNDWRRLAGYEPIEDAFMAAIEAIRQESGRDFEFSAEEAHLARESPEARQQIVDAIRKRAMTRKP